MSAPISAPDHTDDEDPNVLHTGRIGRRFVAYLIDQWILIWVIYFGLFVIIVGYGILFSVVNPCSAVGGYACDSAKWIDRAVMLLLMLWVAIAVHLANVLPAWKHGDSLGMRQVGIKVVSGNPAVTVSKLQFHFRAWLSHPTAIVTLVSIAYFGFPREDIIHTALLTLRFVGLVAVVASAISILMPGHRSLADWVTGTRVIKTRAVSYIAHFALLAVFLPGLIFAAAVAIAAWAAPDGRDININVGGRSYGSNDWTVERLDQLLEFAERLSSTTFWIVFSVAAWLLTVGLCWLALRDTKWKTDRKAGRGMAIVATLITSTPVAVTALSIVWVIAAILVDAFK